MRISSPNALRVLLILAVGCITHSAGAEAFDNDNIPLPEHPRPDFQRQLWLNLNGPWQFRFDTKDEGQKQEWFKGNMNFPDVIMVPFSWGSKLSGVKDEADIGWYRRDIDVPRSWQGERVFLVIGACDWHTTAWLNGNLLDEHQGGYTPFEFDLTPYVKAGKTHRLVLRVDDTPHRFKLQGKQGYGRAAGIWQTVYLEARPQIAFETIHFTPDIDKDSVSVKATLDKPAPTDMKLKLQFKAGDMENPAISQKVQKGAKDVQFEVPIAKPRLWSLEDPYLYEVKAVLQDGTSEDRVDTYFGMRKIGVVNLPGTNFPYIALNNKPVYLQTTLDQAYHPEGFYTFPSDAFMRDEILRTRRIGLNGQRIHIKVEVPRKLYWADRLGVLIMADVPNSWGEPDAKARRETETALRGMIRRDYNHPSIFAWVNFNETWGLTTRDEGYTPETQKWVASIYELTRQLDPTRLVEDNSTNKLDHVITDINSWHAYLPGHRWRDVLDLYCERTYPGSGFNFIGDNKQANQPMMNSECGNVWGYEGEQGGHPTGDIDWSWDYHLMMNEFRRHPKCCGWLYTEHHDVLNEWNGYWRYDRSDKITGLGDLATGMTLRDFHSPFYLATEQRLCRQVKPGQTIQVPLYASFLTDQPVGSTLTLKTKLYGWDRLGQKRTYSHSTVSVPYKPWMSKELEPLKITMPDKSGVAVLTLTLQSASGNALSRNFTTYLVSDGPCSRQETINSGGEKIKVVRFGPDTFKKADWSLKQWNVMDGAKVNGAGSGYFEYHVPWPADLKVSDIAEASLLMELSAKKLHGKDIEGAKALAGDFMLGEGTHDPGRSPNSYPMTDETPFPSAVRVYVADSVSGTFDLADDPADHRGILSWHSQARDYSKPAKGEENLSFRNFKGGELNEAGSYGYLIEARISPDALRKAQAAGTIRIRLEVDDALSGGLAIYGGRFGRYPLDPTLAFVLKN
jgi:hypothetical protein